MDRENKSVLFRNLIKQLADGSISHGDFKATNFIFSGGKLFLTDLDAMRKHRYRSKFQKEFRKDLTRFMKNWSGLPETAELFEELLKTIEI